jgi:hypothetical protein
MATTARLPDDLKGEAAAYAASLGISLNALMAVALRDYLDARKRPALEGVGLAPVAPSPAPGQLEPAASGRPRKGVSKVQPPRSRRAPCPCGSGQQYRHCHELINAAH